MKNKAESHLAKTAVQNLIHAVLCIKAVMYHDCIYVLVPIFYAVVSEWFKVRFAKPASFNRDSDGSNPSGSVFWLIRITVSYT